jgi:peptidyl-prolyl cis-trans isomerase SurA
MRRFRLGTCGTVILACVGCIALSPLQSEIIDRIAISVGNQVITKAQIDEEVRLTAFLNGSQLDLTAEERKKAADRLIEQALVKRDMEFSHYPIPQESDAEPALKALKANYASEAQYSQALDRYGISEEALKRRLWWQTALLRFIDYRFRPGILVSEKDIQNYYDLEVVKWKGQGIKQIPSFEESREKIGELLTDQRIDQAIDQWLADTKKQIVVRDHDEKLP